jgi:hypothetical protein
MRICNRVIIESVLQKVQNLKKCIKSVVLAYNKCNSWLQAETFCGLKTESIVYLLKLTTNDCDFNFEHQSVISKN